MFFIWVTAWFSFEFAHVTRTEGRNSTNEVWNTKWMILTWRLDASDVDPGILWVFSIVNPSGSWDSFSNATMFSSFASSTCQNIHGVYYLTVLMFYQSHCNNQEKWLLGLANCTLSGRSNISITTMLGRLNINAVLHIFWT